MRSALFVLLLTCALGCETTEDAPPADPVPPRPVAAPVAPTPDVPAPPAPEVVEGDYRWGFETSAFTACGSDVAWWLRPEDLATAEAVRRQADTAGERAGSGRGETGRVRLRVRGTLSAPGQHGHLGQYPRELVATEVLPVTAGPCPGPSR